MSVRVRLRGVAELQRALAAMGDRAAAGAAAALFAEGERVMMMSKQEAPVGVDGVLRASGHVEVPKREGSRLTVRLGYGGAAKSYANVIHEGRKPGSRPPPSQALVPWVKKKLFVPEAEAASVAFVVARSIGKKGTKPTKFLERPFMAAVPGMAGRMAERIRRSLERRG